VKGRGRCCISIEGPKGSRLASHWIGEKTKVPCWISFRLSGKDCKTDSSAIGSHPASSDQRIASSPKSRDHSTLRVELHLMI